MGKYLVAALIFGIFLLHCTPTDSRPKNKSKKANHVEKTHLHPHVKGLKGQSVKRDLSRHYIHLPKLDLVRNAPLTISKSVSDNNTHQEHAQSEQIAERILNNDTSSQTKTVINDTDQLALYSLNQTGEAVVANLSGKIMAPVEEVELVETAVVKEITSILPTNNTSENSTQHKLAETESKTRTLAGVADLTQPNTAQLQNLKENTPNETSNSTAPREGRILGDLLKLQIKKPEEEIVKPLNSLGLLKPLTELRINATVGVAEPVGPSKVDGPSLEEMIDQIVSDGNEKLETIKSEVVNASVGLIQEDEAIVIPPRVEEVKALNVYTPNQVKEPTRTLNGSEVEPMVWLQNKYDDLIKVMHLDQQVIPRRLGDQEKAITEGQTKPQNLEVQAKPVNVEEKTKPSGLTDRVKLVKTEEKDKQENVEVQGEPVHVDEANKHSTITDQVTGVNVDEKDKPQNLEVQGEPVHVDEANKLSTITDQVTGVNVDEKDKPQNLEVQGEPLNKDEANKHLTFADQVKGVNADEKDKPKNLEVQGEPLHKDDETKSRGSTDQVTGVNTDKEDKPQNLEAQANPVNKDEEIKSRGLVGLVEVVTGDESKPQNLEAQAKPESLKEEIKLSSLEEPVKQ